MQKISRSLVAMCAVLLLTGCGGGNASTQQQNVGPKKVKPYTDACKQMHADLEKMYTRGRAESIEYGTLLNTYMGRCL